MSAYTWFGCDLVTGQIIEELPIKATSLPLLISSYSTAQVSLPIPEARGDWLTATTPGRSLLVCSRDDDDIIVWGGMVNTREGGSDPEVNLGLITCEGYLDRRYVPTMSFEQVDEADIAAWLVGVAQVEGIGFEIDAPQTGTLRDRDYDDTTDQTVYSKLTELAGVEDGPEWTVDLEWNDDRTAVRKVFRLRKRLGAASDDPEPVFYLPTSVKTYRLTEDYTSSAGANDVQIAGDGEGEARPVSVHARAEDLIASGFPRFELRENVTGVTEQTTLDEHAREVLAFTRNGAQAITVAADAETAPAFGNGWNLGDDVALQVDESYRHPDGFRLVSRAIGADIDPSPGGSVAPVILLDDERMTSL